MLMKNFFPFKRKKILSNFDAINCLLVYYSKMIFFLFDEKKYLYLLKNFATIFFTILISLGFIFIKFTKEEIIQTIPRENFN